MHRPEGRPPIDEAQIVAFAERQHRQVSLAQLEACGLSPAAVCKRERAGRLHRTYLGVYSVGVPARLPDELIMAATLACEPSVASHFSGALVFDLMPDPVRVVHVTVPRTGRNGPDGIVTHRPRRIDECDRTIERGIPVTTPSRVLVDLAGMLSLRSLERLVHTAEYRRLLDRKEVARCIARAGRRPGVRALRNILDLRPSANTNSPGEGRLCDLLARHGMTLPEVNPRVVIDGRRYYPDYLWRAEGLVLELDGDDAHGPVAKKFDAQRQQRLERAGFLVIRGTGLELSRAPEDLIRRVADSLAALRTHPGPRLPT